MNEACWYDQTGHRGPTSGAKRIVERRVWKSSQYIKIRKLCEKNKENRIASPRRRVVVSPFPKAEQNVELLEGF